MALKQVYDPVTKSYKYVDERQLYDLSGGNMTQSVGPGFGPTSPGYAEMGVAAQNLGQTLSSVPGITTGIAGALATAVGNSMMNSEVSPVANPTAPTETAIGPNSMTSSEEDAAAAAAATAAADAAAAADDSDADAGGSSADATDAGTADASDAGDSDGDAYKYGGQIMYYKDGGLAGLAQRVQSKGRYGDTILAHINPQEARMLQQMGGAGTINPHTGLPEFFNPLKIVRNIAKPVLKVAPYVLPFIPGFNTLAPLTQALISGGIGSLQDGKFNFKRGLMSGLTTYGLASLGQGLQNAGTGGASTTPPLGGETMSLDQLAEADAARSAMGSSDLATANAARAFPNTPASPTPSGSWWDQGVQKLKDQGAGIEQLFTNPEAASSAIGQQFGTGKAATTMLGVSGISAVDEAAKLKAEQDAIERSNEERRQRARDIALSTMKANPWNWKEGGAVNMRSGSFVVPADVVSHLGNGSTDAGLMALAKKYGAQPVKGRGDGLSDSIPAKIDGAQQARLTDGEAVVPPHAVAKAGGPKKFYGMLDNIRKARTGTTKQGRQINPNKFMPA